MRAHLNNKISEKVASNDPAKLRQKSEEGEEAKGESDEGRRANWEVTQKTSIWDFPAFRKKRTGE